MKKQKLLLIIGGLFLGFLAGPAKASTIVVYTTTIPDLSSPWSQTLTIPQFNTAMGVLTGVEIQAALHITASIEFLNTLWDNGCPGAARPSLPCAGQQPTGAGGGQVVQAASASIPFTVTGPIGSVTGTVTAAIPGPVVVPPKSNTTFPWLCFVGGLHGAFTDEGGCLSGTYQIPADGLLAISGLTGSTTTPWTSVGLAGWAGSGVALVNFNATTLNTDCYRDAHDGVFVNCSAIAGGAFSVRYTFEESNVPEPMTAVMIGAGLLGIALVRRRRTV